MKRLWLWLIAALVIAALIITCTIKYSTEYADWFAKKQNQEDTQVQSALDMLRNFPTSAGEKR
jgi:hypothetical protein